jgi:hypothetical protein
MTKRLFILGSFSLVVYLYALSLQDLRQQTVRFEWAFFIAFTLYALAVWLVLRSSQPATIAQIVLIFAFGLTFRAVLVFSQPRLSDDMYRYIWDGRVQANDINPYLYSPDAPELAHLRDDKIWPLINRKSAVTVYPAGAELAFAAAWHLFPDSVHGYQVVMAAGDLLAGVLLIVLLQSLGRSPLAVLIYLWSPLIVFETAHSAHVDGLVLMFLVGAWLARVKKRQGLTGLFLGVATALKFYPVLLLPILWKLRNDGGRLRPAWSTPLAFLAGFSLPYLPYLSAGSRMVGFLPNYLKERFNPGLAYFVGRWAGNAGLRPELISWLLLGFALAVIYTVIALQSNKNGQSAVRACIWPIGAFTLLTQNLFPWYMLWLLPFLAIFHPLHGEIDQPARAQLPWASWTGWWLFCGLIALSYTFFIRWRPIPWVAWMQYLPLYTFLIIDLIRWLRRLGDVQFKLIPNSRSLSRPR